MQSRIPLWRSGLAALAAVALALPAGAANRTWMGDNNDWNASTGNWNPADEPDADDAAIFNSSVSVDLANANEAINGLTMSGGADLDLNGNDLSVDGLVQLSGASTNLLVGPSGSVLTADSITINNGSALNLRGGTVTINEEFGAGQLLNTPGGTLSGHGIISLTDAVTPGTTLWTNSGTLHVTSTAIDIGGSTAATLTINASDADARVDLDGVGSLPLISIARNDALVVNVPLSDDFEGTIDLSAGARVEVSVPWSTGIDTTIQVNTVGVTPGTAGAAAILAGGELAFSGSIELDAIDSLRIDCPLTFNVGLIENLGGTLTLNGGAFISSGVVVSLENGATLQGFGEIHAIFVGVGSSAGHIVADNGTLTLAGDFDESRSTLGVTADGILNLPHGWKTSDVEGVSLGGGQITGANVLNDDLDGIRGHGRLSSQLWNETIVVAEGGGTLLIDRPGFDNNWDGQSGDGQYEALTANLELLDTASESFEGGVEVHPGQEAFVNGFALHFQTGSTLYLHGDARYRCTHDTALNGLITVGAGTATIQIQGAADLSIGQAALTGDLVLDSVVSLIGPDSQITGAGALINAAGRRMIAFDGMSSADLGVALINRGTLEIDQPVAAGHTAGQIQGVDFEQADTGVWQLDLGGTGINAFDRLNLTGVALLDGDLDLFLFDGYVPAIGQSFNILSASGGVSGAFDAVLQPAGMPAGRAFSVIYQPTLVQLQVISIPTFAADFDHDNDVDGDDLVQWRGDFSVNGESDADGDGDSDGNDFLVWQRQLGSGPPTAVPTRAVPEPAAGGMLVGVAALLVRGRQQTRRVPTHRPSDQRRLNRRSTEAEITRGYRSVHSLRQRR